MRLEKVLENLCYQDIRNPYCTSTVEELEEYKEAQKERAKRKGKEYKCSCDNCHYGRTGLAEELLKYKSI